MAQRALREQRVRRDQFPDNRAVRISVLAIGRENAPTGKEWDVGIERSLLIDRARHFEIVRAAKFEILVAVSGRGVHKSRSGFRGNMRARKQRNVEIKAFAAEGMRANQAFATDILHA